MGISLRSSSNDEGPGRVWMALLEQHSPSSPVFHNFYLYLYTLAVSPSLGGSRQHKRNKQKQWGFHSVLPAMTRDPAEFGWHCWSNTAHPPPSSTTSIYIYIPWPFPPVWGVADNTKETNKNNGGFTPFFQQ